MTPIKNLYKDTFIGLNLIKLCINCEKEQGVDDKNLSIKGWKIIHATCYRHLFLQLYPSLTIDKIRIHIKTIMAIHQRNGTHASRDLRKKENKALVEWLHKPTTYEKTKV